MFFIGILMFIAGVVAVVVNVAKKKEKGKYTPLVAVFIGLVFIVIGAGSVENNDTDSVIKGDIAVVEENEEEGKVDSINETKEKEKKQKKEKSKEYVELSYESMMRSPEKHEGTNALIYAEVTQIIDEESIMVRVPRDVDEDDYDFSSDLMIVSFNKKILDERLIEEDSIAIYGEFDSLFTYETVLGAESTVPLIKADKIERQ